MTARRDWLDAQLGELAKVYAALEAAGAPEGRRERGSSPTIPVRVDVVDHLTAIEDSVGYLVSRGKALLGWHLPPVPLARRAFLPCPYCECNSLWIDRTRWFVFCGNRDGCRDEQGRRHEWHWDTVEQLGEMVAALLEEYRTDAEITDDAEPEGRSA